MNLVIFLIIFWICRLLINVYYFYRVVNLFKMYENFYKNNDSEVTLYKSEIRDLFKKANIEDGRILYTRPLGFNQIATGDASIIENMFVQRDDIVQSMLHYFNDAISTFRLRIIQNFNPIFWLECIIFLPKKLVEYLGITSSTLFINFFQLVYWTFSVIYSLYKNEINKFIQDFLSNLFK